MGLKSKTWPLRTGDRLEQAERKYTEAMAEAAEMEAARKDAALVDKLARANQKHTLAKARLAKQTQPNSARGLYRIVICGPPRDDFIYKNARGEEYILSMTEKLYPVSELRKWAPKFRGLPVFDAHLQPHESTDHDPREHRGQRIGTIEKTWFVEKDLQIQAILRITDPTWQNSFIEAMYNGTLNKLGFSMTPSIRKNGKMLRVTESAYFPPVEIMELYSVDMTNEPFFGGRFLGEPENKRWSRLAREWHREHVCIGENNERT